MNDPASMRLVECVRDADAQKLLRWKRAAGDAFGERLSFEKLHRQIVVADVVTARRCADDSAGAVDLAHAARADGSNDLVRPEARSGIELHGMAQNTR